MKKLFIIILFIPLAFACSSEDSFLTQGNNSNRKKLSTLSQVTPCTNCEGSNGAYTYANNKLTYIDIDGFLTDEDGSFTHQWESFMAFEHSPNSLAINDAGDKTILNIDTDGKVIDDNIVFNNGYLQYVFPLSDLISENSNLKFNWSNGNLSSIEDRFNGSLNSKTLIEYSDFDDLSGYLGLSIAMDGGLYFAGYPTPYIILGILGKSTTKLPNKRTVNYGDRVYVDEITYIFDEDNYPIKVITTESLYEDNILIDTYTRQTILTYID